MKLSKKVSNLFSTLSILLAALVASTQAGAASTKYDYPISNPYYATVTAAFTRPTQSSPQAYRFVLKPERMSVPLVGGKAYLEYTLYAQTVAAPLVFIVPGVGGTARDSQGAALGEQLYRQGFHVITLPSPLSWSFSIAVSRTGIPGYAPQDAADLYGAMKAILADAREVKNLEVTNFSLIGYSLGGVYASFLRDLDLQEKTFQFRRTVLINPAVDLTYGIRAIDALYNVGSDWSRSERDYPWSRAVAVTQATGKSTAPRDESFFQSVLGNLGLSVNQVKWLIGSEFRNDLADLIFTSQQVNDLGILKTPATANRRTLRQAEAHGYSFDRFSELFVLDYYSRDLHLPRNVLFQRGEFKALEELYANDPTIFVIHNRDDFILSAADAKYLERVFGARAKLFPLGGHMGNIWWPPFKAHLQQIMSGLN